MNKKKYKDLVSKGVISDKADRYDAVEILANIKDMEDIVKRSNKKGGGICKRGKGRAYGKNS